MAFIRAAVTTQTDDCVVWPFGKFVCNGYGAVRFNNKQRCAHRVILILATGQDRTGYDAAHSCNQRACVNPRHLSWKTRYENAQDKHKHGTIIRGEACRGSKLTEKQVLEIAQKFGAQSYVEIARHYGVTPTTIQQIANGATWSWLTGRNRGHERSKAA
jgi:hypothetical protein